MEALIYPERELAYVGSTVTILCLISKPVVWFKDGVQLTMVHVGSPKFQINNVKHEHQGTYVCRNSNSSKIIEATSEILVGSE